MKLSDIKTGETFKIAGIEFIKFSEEDGAVTVVAKDVLFDSAFGSNNNFAQSEILKKLQAEVLPKIEAEVGAENVLEFETDLFSLDGSDVYGKIKTKISLPTLDFYRQNVKIFDKYKPNRWWWLSTPDSTEEHSNDSWILCVSPRGRINIDYFHDSGSGVRPFLKFVSSISVSCEE